MDDSGLHADPTARMSALTALYQASVQRENAIQAGVAGVYTVAFAFTGVILTIIGNHPEKFHGLRAAIVPLPIWVLLMTAVVMGKSAVFVQAMVEHLQTRLERIAGVDRTDIDQLARQEVSLWILPSAGLLVFVPLAVLFGMTVYCLYLASSLGWGWLWWAALYGFFALSLVFSVFSSPRRRRLRHSAPAVTKGGPRRDQKRKR